MLHDPLALPGRARLAPGGHPGQRADRDRLRPRRPGRRAARPGGPQRGRRSRARFRIARRRPLAVDELDPETSALLVEAAGFRRGRIEMQDAERSRLVDEPPAAGRSCCPTARVAGLGPADIDALADELVVADGMVPVRRSTPIRASQRLPRRCPGCHGCRTGRATSSQVLDTAAVIVCCGSGGVGKTTTAAVIGLEAARRGRRVVVVTIDPARRLADALGLADGLGAEPQRIELVAPVPGTNVTSPKHSSGRVVGDDARRRGDLRRAGPPPRREPRSDRRHPRRTRSTRTSPVR